MFVFWFCVLCFEKRELFLFSILWVSKKRHTHTHTHREREKNKKETKNPRERERKKNYLFKTRDTFKTHTRDARTTVFGGAFRRDDDAYDEDEIDRLARANFERRIGAIVVDIDNEREE